MDCGRGGLDGTCHRDPSVVRAILTGFFLPQNVAGFPPVDEPGDAAARILKEDAPGAWLSGLEEDVLYFGEECPIGTSCTRQDQMIAAANDGRDNLWSQSIPSGVAAKSALIEDDRRRILQNRKDL